jgi:hypothetical protein
VSSPSAGFNQENHALYLSLETFNNVNKRKSVLYSMNKLKYASEVLSGYQPRQMSI